jgi:hypothetical protein
MRTYLSSGYRSLPGGSIEVEGRWAGVQWIALAMLPLLFLGWRSPFLLGLVGLVAAALWIFPARRRVVFDPDRACLRIEHAGFFSEPGAQRIPFAEVSAVIFHEERRRAGKAQLALFARTGAGPVYLVTHAGRREAEELAERIRRMMERTW